MKVFITGGTGFIGKTITARLVRDGHTITLLTRSLRKEWILPEGASFLQGDPTRTGRWQSKITDHDAIINLAGASIFTRWTRKAKKKILESRILSTRHIVEAIDRKRDKKIHLINASAVGYYGACGDEKLDEGSPPGEDFLAHVVSLWESEARNAQRWGTRAVLCRFGIVLGKKGGALANIVPYFKRYIGAPFGKGTQWFSWIHEKDLAEIILFLLMHTEIDGPVNCTAPHPVRNKEMTKILGEVLHRPTFLPGIPSFALRAALGQSADILVKGQRVLPIKLRAFGFGHRFPTLKEALENLLVF